MQIRLTKSFIAAGMMALALLTVASCKEKKKDYIIVTHKPIVVKSQKPRAMGDTQQSRHVSWLGNTYTVTVGLKADPSLPLASDGEQKYYDNRITLRITRGDGSVFLETARLRRPTSRNMSTRTMTMARCLASCTTRPRATTSALRPAWATPTSRAMSSCPWCCRSAIPAPCR